MKTLTKNDYIPVVRLCAIKEKEVLYGDISMNMSEKVVEWSRKLIQHADREYVLIIPVNTQAQPVGIEIVAIGGVDHVEVDIKNIFKNAILSNAVGLFVVHNHPSGKIEPSRDDIRITEKIIKAGRFLDIDILDHLIITSNNYVSIREMTNLWD